MQRKGHPRAVGGSAAGRSVFARRVRDLVSASVRAGFTARDERLTEEHLMEQYGATRAAVREALRLLADDGTVDRHPGTGTVVVRRGIQVLVGDCAGVDPVRDTFDLLTVDQRWVPSTPLLRHRLRLDDPRLQLVENLFLHEGTPLGVRTAYFRIGRNAAQYDGAARLADVCRGFFGTELGDVGTEIGSARADQRTARLLGIDEGSPVLVREQTAYDLDANPIQVVFDTYRSDVVSFVEPREIDRTELTRTTGDLTCSTSAGSSGTATASSPGTGPVRPASGTAPTAATG